MNLRIFDTGVHKMRVSSTVSINRGNLEQMQFNYSSYSVSEG